MWATHRQGLRSGYGRLSNISRSTSSSSNPYPFPVHANPSPYQIFHLPHNASQADIKNRYIDLVRIYHPDSPVSRALPPEITDGRFQSITRAYDILRRKTSMMPGLQSRAESHNPTSAAWRAQRARRLDLDTGGDDRWKDRVIVFGVVLTIAAFVAQITVTRQEALSEIRQSPFTFKGPPARGSQSSDDRILSASEGDGLSKDTRN